MQPSPADRLIARLLSLPPDGLRALLAEWDRAEAQGGGDVSVTIKVQGRSARLVVAREYAAPR